MIFSRMVICTSTIFQYTDEAVVCIAVDDISDCVSVEYTNVGIDRVMGLDRVYRIDSKRSDNKQIELVNIAELVIKKVAATIYDYR